MSGLSDDKLLVYNKEGLIPGPGEERELFVKRAEYCLTLREHLGTKLPFTPEMEAPADVIQQPCQQTRALYDLASDWVPVFFSNYQLMPWHGGCAWIFQLSDSEPTAAFFQLRQGFRHSSTYLGLYDRNELMAHELVHVGRMMFEEPKFEEVLAYRTSKSRWRQLLGPLVQSSKESAWFVFLLLPIILLDLYTLFKGNLFWTAMWLKLLPTALIVAAFIRLWRRQTTFKRTLNNIKAAFQAPDAVIYRLTDKEIELFATLTPEDIRSYAVSQSCLRWHLIRLAYYP